MNGGGPEVPWVPVWDRIDDDFDEQVLQIPFASGGAGHAGGAHAVDEYATIAGLRTHMRQSIAFLHRFARTLGGVTEIVAEDDGTEEAYDVD